MIHLYKYQVGDKVVPIKTDNGVDIDSPSLRNAKAIGQPFLYVIRLIEGGRYSCSEGRDDVYGDWYEEENLQPYKKKKVSMKKYSKVVQENSELKDTVKKLEKELSILKAVKQPLLIKDCIVDDTNTSYRKEKK